MLHRSATERFVPCYRDHDEHRHGVLLDKARSPRLRHLAGHIVRRPVQVVLVRVADRHAGLSVRVLRSALSHGRLDRSHGQSQLFLGLHLAVHQTDHLLGQSAVSQLIKE